MVAGERLVDDDGYEIFLFPCDAMYVTQGEHDVLALDFGPRNTSGGRIVGMKCYAPFTGTIVYTGNDHNCILQSDKKVHFADGTIAYARVLVAHSYVAPIRYSHYTQGQQFYTTGDYGLSSGEHLHMEIAKVDDKSTKYWNTGGIGLYQAIHMWNGMYDNDTVLLNDGDYDWKTYEGGVTPPTPSGTKKENKFPWVLYANRLRNRL